MLENVSISANSLVVREVTSYVVSVYTSNAIPANGGLLVTFPSDFSSLSSSSLTCDLTLDSAPVATACSVTDHIVAMNNVLPAGAAASLKLVLTMKGVTNPDFAVITQSFSVSTTADSRVIDSKTSGISVTLLPAELISASLVPESSKAGEWSKWTISLQTKYTIGSGVSIAVVFPDWNAALLSANSPESMKTAYASTVTCSGTFIDSNCLLRDRNTFKADVTSAVSGALSFQVSVVRSPPLTGETVGFEISTGTTTGLIEKKTGLSVTVKTPATFPLSFSVLNSLINALTTYSFSLEPSLPIPQGAVVIVTFPVSIGLNSIQGQLSGTIGIETGTALASGNYVTINYGYSLYASVVSIKFSLDKVKNPGSTRPSGDISVRFQTKGGKDYLLSEAAVSIIAVAGVLQSLSVSLSTAVINALSTYTFSFTMTNSVPTDGGIRLELPTELTFDTGQSQCVSASVLSEGFRCEFQSRVLLVTKGFAGGGNPRTVSIVISNIKNAPTTKQSGKIPIATYDSSDFLYEIDKSSDLTVTASADTMQFSLVLPKSFVTGETTSYTLTLQTKNEIPVGGWLTVTFPSEVSFTNSNVQCSAFGGFEATASCVIDQQVVTVKNGFLSSAFKPGELSLTVPLVRNPPSTKPTSVFSAASLSSDGQLIDQAETATMFAMTTPHEFVKASVASSSTTVGGTADFTFAVTPKNPIYQNSIFLVAPPTGLTLPTSPVCSTEGSIATKVICAVSNQVLSVTVTIPDQSSSAEVRFSIKGMRNPSSTKQTASFTVTSTISGYLIDRVSTNLVISATTPGTLTAVVSPGVTGISVITDYTFQLKLANGGPQNGYVLVTIPAEITVTTDTRVTDSVGNALVFALLASAIKAYVFPEGVTATDKTFIIRQMKNGQSITTQSQFTISSFTEDGFQVDSGVSNSVQFGCYSPCATCTFNPSTCLSCLSVSTTPFFYDGECHAACKTGYLAVSPGNCQPCNSDCYTCANNVNSCSQCISNGAKPYLYNSQCLAVCPLTTYPNSQGECTACDSNCQSCSGAGTDKCLTCIASKLLYYGQCLSACPTSSMQVASECVDCAVGCLTCSGSQKTCGSCTSAYVKYGDSCLTSCPADTTVQVGGECQQCDTSCLTCKVSISQCASCPPGTVLTTGKCLKQCPSGQYSDSGECRLCSDECQECSERADKCVSCKAGAILYQSHCLSSCPSGLAVASGSVCVDCLGTCKTCAGSVSHCTSCPSGLYLQDSACVATCPSAYFAQVDRCQPCSQLCTACFAATNNCLSCVLGYYLYGSQCIESCPARSTVLDGQTCVACQRPCLTCERAAKYCTTCISGLLALEGECVEACPTGYDSLDGVCKPDELPAGQCAKGCTSEKLQNSVCDPACNFQSCGFDNDRCNPNSPLNHTVPSGPLPNGFPPTVTSTQPLPVYIIPRYSDELQVREVPMPTSAVSVAGTAAAVASKLMFGGTSLHSALVSVSGIASPLAGVGLAFLLLDAENVHGKRKLIDYYNGEISGPFTATVVILTVHIVLNVLFVYVYFQWVRGSQVLPKDFIHRNWRSTYPTAANVFIVLSAVFSYKTAKLMTSNLFGRTYFSAAFQKKAHLYSPLQAVFYLSLVLLSLPLLSLSVYILLTFSTGSTVFMMAIDCAVVTTSDAILSVLTIVYMRREIRTEKAKFELPKFSVETQETAVLDLEQIHVQMAGELEDKQRNERIDSQGQKYFDSERDVYEGTAATSQAADLTTSRQLSISVSNEQVNVSFSIPESQSPCSRIFPSFAKQPQADTDEVEDT